LPFIKAGQPVRLIPVKRQTLRKRFSALLVRLKHNYLRFVGRVLRRGWQTLFRLLVISFKQRPKLSQLLIEVLAQSHKGTGDVRTIFRKRFNLQFEIAGFIAQCREPKGTGRARQPMQDAIGLRNLIAIGTARTNVRGNFVERIEFTDRLVRKTFLENLQFDADVSGGRFDHDA
jgi:hypothetical protein